MKAEPGLRMTLGNAAAAGVRLIVHFPRDLIRHATWCGSFRGVAGAQSILLSAASMPRPTPRR